MKLFGRKWRVSIAGIEFDSLDIDFDVYKSTQPEPNKCSLTIYGLGPDIRRSIEELNLYEPKKVPKASGSKSAHHSSSADGTSLRGESGGRRKVAQGPKPGKIPVVLEAGLGTEMGVIFSGNLRRGITEKNPPEVVFKIEGEDGGRTYLTTRVRASWPENTTRLVVVKDLLREMGLGQGNLNSVSGYLLGAYRYGTSVTGQASAALRGILSSGGVSYSIQNGNALFRHPQIKSEQIGYVLGPDSGLVGAPSRDATGSIQATCLLVPAIHPGALVQLTGTENDGVYYVRTVHTVGQTAGNDWHHKLELIS